MRQRKRQLNVIVHNVPEPTEDTGQGRKKKDMDTVTRVLKNNLKVSATVENSIRLGKKGYNPRLIKVTVNSHIKYHSTEILMVLIIYLRFYYPRSNPKRMKLYELSWLK